jgi:hypothetical protein
MIPLTCAEIALSVPVLEPSVLNIVEEAGKSFRNFRFDYARILQRLEEN